MSRFTGRVVTGVAKHRRSPETISTLLPVRTFEKNIGGFTAVRYSVRYAKWGVKGIGNLGR